MQNFQDIFHSLSFPDFTQYVREPRNSLCSRIDATRLLVEVIASTTGGFGDSQFSRKILLGGEYSLVMRYKREKDNSYRPTCALSFGFYAGKVVVGQLQGSSDKSIAYRFASSFDTVGYFAHLLEEAFIQKGIQVSVEPFPEGLEGVSYASQAHERYTQLSHYIHTATQKKFAEQDFLL